MPFDGSAYPNFNLATDPRALAMDIVIDALADPRHWCQRDYVRTQPVRTPEGKIVFVEQRCILGALRLLQQRPESVRLALRIAIKRSIREVTGVAWAIDGFNDHPATTHDDVMRVLRCARARLAAGERYTNDDLAQEAMDARAANTGLEFEETVNAVPASWIAGMKEKLWRSMTGVAA